MKRYHKENRACFAGALFATLTSSVFAVALQFFKGDVLDSAVAGDHEKAISHALLLFGFILLEVLFYYLYRRLESRYTAGCTRLLKQDVFEAILRRSYVAYKSRPQGEYVAKYSAGADAVRERRFAMLPLFFNILFKIVLVSGALFLLDWRVALLTIALLTTPLYLPKLIEKRLQRAQAAYLDAVKDALAKVSDWLSGFEIIKNFSIEQQIMKRFQEENDGVANRFLSDARLGALAQIITTLMSYLSYFIVLAAAAWLVLAGDFSAGDFFVAIGMIDQLSYPLITLAGIIRQLIAIRPACREMAAFITEGSGGTSPSAPPRLRREIRFRGVTFAYGEKPPVLRDFSFALEKGKRYLLQGPSGCGKTTAVNLLLRYYDADAGRIEIDGAPIGAYADTYGLITVVRQEAVLFSDTLRNNLTMYRDIPDARLTAMLRRLGLEKFATAEALSAMVAEGGANLSGGEKKRVCLARALLRDTDVLILDEPLANLDDETAERIEDLLLSIEGRTLLVVSHQFSREKRAAFDRVVTLGKGA